MFSYIYSWLYPDAVTEVNEVLVKEVKEVEETKEVVKEVEETKEVVTKVEETKEVDPDFDPKEFVYKLSTIVQKQVDQVNKTMQLDQERKLTKQKAESVFNQYIDTRTKIIEKTKYNNKQFNNRVNKKHKNVKNNQKAVQHKELYNNIKIDRFDI